jgi:hypothetical protein
MHLSGDIDSQPNWRGCKQCKLSLSVTPLSHYVCIVGPVPRSGAVPDPPALLEQLERVLASRDFDASSRGRALLRFLFGEMLANPEESPSLATIARRVFRRGEDFDSRLDPAVGIEVARLGRALDRYYRLAGAGDSVRISLPRGASAPVAQWVSRRASVRRGSSLDLEESPVVTPS